MSRLAILALSVAIAAAVTCPGHLYTDNNWPSSVNCATHLPSTGTCDFANYIAPHEGCSLCAYSDSLGLPTIGIGYLLQKGQDQPLPAGLNLEQLAAGKQALTNAEVVTMFNEDVQAAITLDKSIFSNWNQLCCNVEQVIVDMTFVMMNKLKNFKHMIAAVEAQNWEEAAAQIEDSTWCKQVHTRCTDDVNQMKKGCPKNGSSNKEAANKEAGNKEAGNKEAGNKESPNKETHNKESPNKESPKDSGKGSGNKGSDNKEPHNKAPKNNEEKPSQESQGEGEGEGEYQESEGEGEYQESEGESGEDESGEGESGEDESGEGESGEDESGEGESGEDESGEGESGEDESGEEESGEEESGEDESGEDESGEGESDFVQI